MYNLFENNINNQSITDYVLVLDLDSTVINSFEDFKVLKELNIFNNAKLLNLKQRCYTLKLTDVDKPGDGVDYDYWGIKRPHVDEFVLFALNYFRLIIIYTAADQLYGDAIADVLFKSLKMPDLIWASDKLVAKKKKPLKKLVESEFGKKHNLQLNKLLHIDDNEDTFVNNVKNAIHIPAYCPDPTLECLLADDDTLLKIKYFLLLPVVRTTGDITKLDLTNIFDKSVVDYQKMANLN